MRFDNVHPSQRRGAGVQLKGSVAVVTGASSGIGEAVAVALAQRGAKVVLAARRKDRLDDLADRIDRAGGTALAVRCDVTDREQLTSLPSVVKEAFGPCDILVNNAGVPGGGTFADLTYQQIDAIIQVNVLGVMYGTRAFLPGMLKRRHGHIVNVASLAGRFATPGAAVYGASKHAVVAFSESVFYEVEDQGVLVTAVNPGFVRTESFPLVGMDRRMILTLDRVAGAVVRVVRDDIAPELSVPRYISPLQAFRVLTPPLYRWGVRKGRDMGLKGTKAADG
jgi:NADP-dependent 3-hydroxy acid dehydrogenase YdfG